MASLSDILSFGWPGEQWSCTNHPNLSDAYATLSWAGPAAKPTLAEVEAQSTATEAHLAAEARKQRQTDKLLEAQDAILGAFDVVGDALAEIATKAALRAGQSYDQTIINRVQALRQKVAAAKAVT